jgi:hypothetical protein
MHRLAARVILTGVLLTAAARATVGQVITVEIQPRTYASPNGEYRLHVKPGERHGGGPAEYTLTRNGATVWNGERGFTLLDVILTDEGAAAGYGYWKGPQGFGDLNRKSLTKEELKEARKRMEELRDALEKAATSGASRPADGLPVPEFPMEPDTDWACIVYLSASGDVKLCHRIPRSGESSCLSSPSVAVGYVSLDTANDSLTAIVHHNRPSDDHTNLVVFRVSTATVLVDMPLEKRLEPRTPVFHVFAARAIRGTPLTVVSYAGRKR